MGNSNSVPMNVNVNVPEPVLVHVPVPVPEPEPVPNPATILPIHGTIKILTATGLIGAWAGGSAFFLNRYKAHPNLVIKLTKQAILPSGICVAANVHEILQKCFEIPVEIKTLEALDAIWKSYIEGDMKKNLEKVIVTDELRSLATDELKRIAKEEGKAPDDVKDVYITLEISEDNYGKTRDYLLESALRNHVEETSKSSSSTFEETPTISTHVQNVGLCLEDTEKQTKPIVFEPGKIEWKVIKKLLTKARDGSVIGGKITLDIPDTIDTIVPALVETSANVNVLEAKIIRLESEMKDLAKENEDLKEENKKLNENLPAFKKLEPKILKRVDLLREELMKGIATSEQTVAWICLGELCCEIQNSMYEKILPEHYNSWSNYNFKSIEKDINNPSMVESESERVEAAKNWQELKASLDWNKGLERTVRLLQKSRNAQVHPPIDETFLRESAMDLDYEKEFRGRVSLKQVNKLIDIWKHLKQEESVKPGSKTASHYPAKQSTGQD